MTALQHLVCEKSTSVLVLQILDEDLTTDEQAEALRQEMFAALDQHPSRKVAIDLGKVDTFGSVSFRPFLSLYRKLQAGKGRIILCNVRPHLIDMFETTRLVNRQRKPGVPFELADNLADGMARLKLHRGRIENDALILTLTEPHLQGDAIAEELSEELLLTAKQHNATRVIVDFRQVEVLSSACVRPLLQLRNHVKSRSGQVILCQVSQHVEEALLVTRLISTNSAQPMPFGFARSVEEALAKA